MKDVDLQLLPAEIRELLLLSGVLSLKNGQKPKLFIRYNELKSDKEHTVERVTVMVFSLIY